MGITMSSPTPNSPTMLARQRGLQQRTLISATQGVAGALSVTVVGASGALARSKIFPALFTLQTHGLLPPHTAIVGIARTKLSERQFHQQVISEIVGPEDEKAAFLSRCHYVSGDYSSAVAFNVVRNELEKREAAQNRGATANRIFYLAVPPASFLHIARSVHAYCMSKTGFNRVIVERPFGTDLESCTLLSAELSKLFSESQIYRMGEVPKLMCQNLLVLRFANRFFEPMWSNRDIASVQIVYKETDPPLGSYFADQGVIRDSVQSHVLQLLTLVAMECPVSLMSDAIRDEKLKVLRSIVPIKMDDVVLGSVQGAKGIPSYAAIIMYINNRRWAGVPFVIRSGRSLNERKIEVRLQMKPGRPSMQEQPPRNEIVVRIHPNPCIYMKIASKKPGITTDLVQTELDFNYPVPVAGMGTLATDDATLDDYERITNDAFNGNASFFARSDELIESWRIVDPILKAVDNKAIPTVEYEPATRGPKEAQALLDRAGFVRDSTYEYK